MKAMQATERGGYEAVRLVDIPQPQPQAGQALVRVTSAGVTPLDRTVLAGLHPSARKLPLVPGNEGAGVVMEDPSGRFSVGERVLFFAGPGGVAQDGTFAEMTSVPSGNLASLPGEIADEIAGGLPVAYLSAFLALRQVCPGTLVGVSTGLWITGRNAAARRAAVAGWAALPLAARPDFASVNMSEPGTAGVLEALARLLTVSRRRAGRWCAMRVGSGCRPASAWRTPRPAPMASR